MHTTNKEHRDILGKAENYISENRVRVFHFLHRLLALDRKLLLRTEILDLFTTPTSSGEDEPETIESSPLGLMISWVQEAFIYDSSVCFALRHQVGRWIYLRIHTETLDIDQLSSSRFLELKEQMLSGGEEEWVLELDIDPFLKKRFKLKEPDSIGRGVEFLNRRLSSQLFEGAGDGIQQLFNFLRLHSYNNQQLMLNDGVEDIAGLRNALRQADRLLKKCRQIAPGRS